MSNTDASGFVIEAFIISMHVFSQMVNTFFFCRHYRYIACGQFVRWCSGFLGKNIQVPLPSSVVNIVCDRFPSLVFEGYHEAPVDLDELA